MEVNCINLRTGIRRRLRVRSSRDIFQPLKGRSSMPYVSPETKRSKPRRARTAERKQRPSPKRGFHYPTPKMAAEVLNPKKLE